MTHHLGGAADGGTVSAAIERSIIEEPEEELVGGSTLFRFVARQPILDSDQNTFAYELLFRSGWENHFNANHEVASRHIVDNAIAFGLEWLVGSSTAFVNCTRRMVLLEIPVILPLSIVLELPPDTDVDEDLVTACMRLKQQGHRFAIDRYDLSPRWEPLLGVVDFIKVDFSSVEPRTRQGLVRKLAGTPVKLLAARLETGAAYLQAKQEGFQFFQGFYFTRPVVFSRPALGPVLHRLRFLDELSHASLNFNRILELLREEPGMSYRILRLANAAAVGARSTISNLRMALVLVGENRFRKLAITALTVELCGTQPDEAHRTILQKARFCELIAGDCNLEPEAMYLFGMLSVVFRILNLDMTSMASTIQLHPEMLDALAGVENIYSRVLQCAESYDCGDWDGFSTSSQSLGRSEHEISQHLYEARDWADHIFSDMQ